MKSNVIWGQNSRYTDHDNGTGTIAGDSESLASFRRTSGSHRDLGLAWKQVPSQEPRSNIGKEVRTRVPVESLFCPFSINNKEKRP